jgi:ribosomal protein L39E
MPATGARPTLGAIVHLAWDSDPRPSWRIELHYERPTSEGALMTPAAAQQFADALRATGKARRVAVDVGAFGTAYRVSFLVKAAMAAIALRDAPRIAEAARRESGIPVWVLTRRSVVEPSRLRG